MTIVELVKLYDDYNFSVGKRPATRRWHVSALRLFVNFAGAGRPLEEITTVLVDNYRLDLMRRSLAVESVNTYLRSLAACLAWSSRRGYLVAAVEVERVQVAPQRPKAVFSSQEFEQLLASTAGEKNTELRRRARAILYLLYDTGLRASEVTQCKIGDITPENGVKILTVAGAKTGRLRSVPLSGLTWQAIEDYRRDLPAGASGPAGPLFLSSRDPDSPLTVSGLRTLCKRLADRAGLHANPHKFRRAFATFWLNQGAGDLETLMQIGGWQDRETVLRHYATISTDTLIRAHSRYSPLSTKN